MGDTMLKRLQRQYLPRDLVLSVLCSIIGSILGLTVLLALLLMAVNSMNDIGQPPAPAATPPAATTTSAPTSNATGHGQHARPNMRAKAKAAVMRHTRTVLRPRAVTPNVMRRRIATDPLTSCVTPFGTRLGIADGVPAYSNCNTHFHGNFVNFVNRRNPLLNDLPRDPALREDYIMTADRYTAMDYVIRWLIINRGLQLPLSKHIYNLYEVVHFVSATHAGNTWDAIRIPNGAAAATRDERVFVAPRRGDCIIYGDDGRFDHEQNGHIAVIVRVEDDVDAVLGRADGGNNNSSSSDNTTTTAAATSAGAEAERSAALAEKLRQLRRRRLQPRRVYIAEQNLRNEDWQGHNYSRVLSFYWDQYGDDDDDAATDDNRADGNRSLIAGEGERTARPAPRGVLVDPDGLWVIGRVRVGAIREYGSTETAYEAGLKTRYSSPDHNDL